MPSAESFIAVGDSSNADSLAVRTWGALATLYELQAILVVRYDVETNGVEVQWAHNLPAEAFNGSEKCHLVKAIAECFLVHPKPHVHAMKANGLATVAHHLNRNLKEQYRMWFFPVRCGGNYFVFLSFPEPDKGKGLPVDLKDQLSMAFTTLDGCLRASELQSRLEVTEKFVKEVGHDVASSVQASVAKLWNMSEGRITGEAVRVKAKEIEYEIWSVYRVAESLGIVADPSYELQLPDDFDLSGVVRTVLKHFYSEAAERNIRLRALPANESVSVWGDKTGIQQAVGQLVLNAIKYSFGGTEIAVSSSERDDDFLIRVTNKGHPLPEGRELKQIWDFGYRGKLAKELHVNGSGIGLYTVKKIVSAHRGWVDAQSRDGTTEFFVHLPKKAALKRDLGILV